jgi:DNA-binding MarR family transcriptional regulator
MPKLIKNRLKKQEIYSIIYKKLTKLEDDMNTVSDNSQVSLLAMIRWVNSEYEEMIAKETANNKILNQRAVRSMLKILSMNNGISQNQLAREVHLKGSTVSIALDKMEAEGLIRREDSYTDKRKVNIHLTSKGYELKKEIECVVERIEEKMLASLSESNKYTMRESLSIILENCK